jgi:hypothetical protein
MSQRRGGIISVQINGKSRRQGQLDLQPRTAEARHHRRRRHVHGYKEVPQAAFIEGEITDRSTFDLDDLVTIVDATVTLELANGKVIVLRSAWFAGEGTGNTEEGNIAVRFEG